MDIMTLFLFICFISALVTLTALRIVNAINKARKKREEGNNGITVDFKNEMPDYLNERLFDFITKNLKDERNYRF